VTAFDWFHRSFTDSQDPAAGYGGDVSVEVPINELFDQIGRWGFGYLLTVSDDARSHVLALRPTVVDEGDARMLRFDAGGGRACRNASARPDVSLVFPPADHADGFSLVVDGRATVDGDHIDIRPTWAVLHRPAP
jgi:hypothetical protein